MYIIILLQTIGGLYLRIVVLCLKGGAGASNHRNMLVVAHLWAVSQNNPCDLKLELMYGIISHTWYIMPYMPKATLIFKEKLVFPDNAVLEGVIWQLPQASTERPHGLKYRLYYGKAGERIIAYDNERGKGDHCHYRSQEQDYRFTTVEQLVADFLADVRRERGES